jgi:hypothetical protein
VSERNIDPIIHPLTPIFRPPSPLLQAFAKRGFLLVALAQVDASVLRLQAMGCKVDTCPPPASPGRQRRF